MWENTEILTLNYLISEQGYHTTECFIENLLAIEIKQKTKIQQIIVNRPAYLGLSILELSKLLICEF